MHKQLLLLLTLFSAVLFTSCNGGKEGGSSSGSSSDQKVFRYNQTGGLKTLDPAFSGDRATVWACTQIYNGLLTLDANLRLHPAIAEEWDISEDEKVYTFKLKKGVYFHDNKCFKDGKGREVTAYDFVYSFKRIMDPRLGSTGAWIFRNVVPTNPDGSAHDDAFVAVDDYTFKITLVNNFIPFLESLAMPYASVVPIEAIDKYGKDFRSHPVGTGPFMFKTWNEGEALSLVKNNKYWRKSHDGHQLPYLDGIIVSFIEDPAQAFREFEAGKLDFITGLPENAKGVLESDGKVKTEMHDKYNIEKVPYMNTEYIGFQLDPKNYKEEENHPFLNTKFRQALSYAINREDLIASLRNGMGTPGISGITPIALPSFDSSRVKGYRYNKKKALQLLEEAGYKGGEGLPEIVLHTYTTDKQISEFVQKQWEQIGVKVKIKMEQFVTHKDDVDNGKINLFRGSWLGDYPDAENYLAMFYSKNFAPTGPNKTHYSNPDFDKVYDDTQKILDANENFIKKYDQYVQLENILMKDAPVVVLYYDDILRLYQKKVVNLKTNASNILVLEEVNFSTSK